MKLNYIYFLCVLLGMALIPGTSKAQDTLQGLLPLRNMAIVYDTIVPTTAPQENLVAISKHWLKEHHYVLTDSNANLISGTGYFYISWNPSVMENDPVRAMHSFQFAFIEGHCRIRLTFTDAAIIKPDNVNTESLLQFATEHNAHPSMIMLNDRAKKVMREGAAAVLKGIP